MIFNKFLVISINDYIYLQDFHKQFKEMAAVLETA